MPEWGIEALSAKADTGAKSSAIDVTDLKELPDGRLCFKVILDRGQLARTREVVCAPLGRSRVRSSNGQVQTRYRVRTLVKLGEHAYPAEFTLVNRAKMIHRILLGRLFLGPHFLVDSCAKYRLTAPPFKPPAKPRARPRRKPSA